MRIAVLSPFYPYRGGIAQFSARLYQVLEKENEVKAFSFSRLYPQLLFPGKTQYVETPAAADEIQAGRVLDSLNPFSYQRTAQAIAAFRPDVLIIAYWMPFFAPAYGHIASRLKKTTTIITLVHNAIAHETHFWDRPLTRMFFKQSQGFVVMSEIVKADLLSLCPQASYLLHPHPLYDHFGVKIERAIAQETLGLETGKKNLLFFGLIREYKGLDLLIDAMASLDSSYQLIIAGEPYGSFDSYRKQIEASPARDRIKVFDRYIADEEVFRFFSATDLLVLPYRQATQSGVIPIAYHFETPVLATDVGSLRATLELPGTGRVCPADGASIAAGIEKMFAGNLEDFISKIRLEKQHLSWEYFARAVTGFAATLKNVV